MLLDGENAYCMLFHHLTLRTQIDSSDDGR